MPYVSLIPRLHCPAFYALWKNTTLPVFSKVQKKTGQWSLGTRLAICVYTHALYSIDTSTHTHTHLFLEVSYIVYNDLQLPTRGGPDKLVGLLHLSRKIDPGGDKTYKF